MSDPKIQPYNSAPVDENKLRFSFLSSIRRKGPSFAAGVAGGAAIATVVALAATGIAPLLVGAAATGGIAWLQSIGGNALAGWLGNWSAREGGRFLERVRGEEADEELTTALAVALQEQIEKDDILRDDLAVLLKNTEAVQTLLASLPNRGEQEALLLGLQNDIHSTYLAQGQMQDLLSSAIRQLGEQLKAQLQAVQIDVRALHPAQRLIVSHEEFFAPYLRKGRLFHHLTELVGRSDQLDNLIRFADSERYQAAILSGPGGIGKSKLLLEFAERRRQSTARGPSVRLVSDGVSISPTSLNEVPPEPVLLLIDDAHRREDLGSLFHLAARRAAPIKLLVTCRPQAAANLRSELQQAGYDITQILELPRLELMPPGDVEELARLVLGVGHARYAEALAAVSRDCPLVTIVGGRLLADHAIPPALLASDENFRHAVLDRFRTELIGNVSTQIDSVFCRRLIDLLSVLGPVRTSNGMQLDAVAEFLHISRADLVRALGILEDTGVLLRRGYSVRLMPDVLSDFVLHEACFTPQGTLTGFADEVYDAFHSTFASNVLRNLAELDWRVRSSQSKEPDVLAQVWVSVEAEFTAGGDGERHRILSNLREVALYQPGRVLPLIEQAMRPSHVPSDTSQGTTIERLLYGNPGRRELLHLLPELLRRVAYSLQYLPGCCDLLWQLGRDDDRPLNSTPDHAIRVLQDLAAYDPDKPLSVNQAVIDAVVRWLKEPHVHGHLHSPIDVLDPVLAKSGHSDRARGNMITWSPFFVHKENTQALRDRTYELLASCFVMPDLKIKLRVIESLDKATAPVAAYNGLTITEDVEAEWLPEQLRALDMLEAVVVADVHPLILLRVMEVAGFRARYRRVPELAKRARRVIAQVPDSFDLRLTRALLSGPADFWLIDDEDVDTAEEHMSRWERQQRAAATMRRTVAQEFVTSYPDPNLAVSELNTRLGELQGSGFQPHPEMVVFELASVNIEYGAQLCNALIAAPAGPLTPYLSLLLSAIRAVDVPQAISLGNRALATDEANKCMALANSYSWRNWEQPPTTDDLNLLRTLVSHPQPAVKAAALQTLAAMAWRQPTAASAGIDIALSLDVGEDPDLADVFCSVFHLDLGVPPDMLSDEQVTAILSKLRLVKSIGGSLTNTSRGTSEFLSWAAHRLPIQVVDLLLDRLDYAEKANASGYEPVPYHFYGLDLNGLAASEGYGEMLRRVRDRLLTGPEGSRFWVQQLFPIVSLRFGGESLSILGEWISSGDPECIRGASSLLAEAPPNFVFGHEDMIVKLLESAYAEGMECYEAVSSNLYRSAVSREMNRTVGEPSDQVLAVRTNANAAAHRNMQSIAAHTFYLRIVEWAEQHLEYDAMSDEELMM